MNTDENGPDLQTANNTAFLLKQETHNVIGCAFQVLNELGHGLNEKCYENALVVEFRLRSIAFSHLCQSVSICGCTKPNGYLTTSDYALRTF